MGQQQQDIAELKQRLDEANMRAEKATEKVNELATTTVTAAANTQALDEMRNIAERQADNKK